MRIILALLCLIGVMTYEESSTYVPEQSKTVMKGKGDVKTAITDIDINMRDVNINRRRRKRRKNRRRRYRNRRRDEDDDFDYDDDDITVNQDSLDYNYY